MERGQVNRSRRPQQRTMEPTPRRRQPRRRKKKYTLHYLLLFLFCLGLGITLCMTVLFKVNSIKVENAYYYSSEELISRSGIAKGDNLFRINVSDIEAMLEDKFPYIQSVNIKRRLPATVVLDVTEETEMGSAYTEEGFAIVSDTGKVLKSQLHQAESGIPVLLGLEDENFSVGSYLYEMSEDKTRVLTEKVQLIQRFLQEAETQGLSDLTYIDINDSMEIKVLYDERILIDFGGEIDLAKKIGFVLRVLDEGIAENHPLSGYTNENFEGTIDITNRKQLRTRALAVSTLADQRAFTVFEEEDAFFAEDEEAVTEEETPSDETAEEEKPVIEE